MDEIQGRWVLMMRTLPKIFSATLAISLLLSGGLFAPVQAHAGFFSFLGDQAYADAGAVDSSKSNKNSQTLDLLQANVSSASIIQDKITKKDSKSNIIDPNANVNIVADNAILPATGPLGVSGGADIPDSSNDQTSVYVVRKGDSFAQIAQMFGVSVNTILLANDMKKGDKLTEGQVLLILPISGIEHTVTKGQTLQSIAKLYKADIGDIAAYNGITEDTKLAVGDKIMIPGGDNMADEGGDKPAPNLSKTIVQDRNYYESHPIQNIAGYFVNPVPNGYKTQGLHGPGHRGIDIGSPTSTGTSIYAAASGTVILVKTGCRVGQTRCGGGYGNMVILQHSNGTKTLYGHMSKVITHIGDQVAQGETIGLMGSTGHSTGPHLHFEVFNAKNPGSDWSWAN